MMTVIILLVTALWVAAIWSLAKDKRPFESDEQWRRRRREELRRKITR